ncbi:MAG: hypothetical protein WC980_05605 [Candidatus Brocadiia bacterium]
MRYWLLIGLAVIIISAGCQGQTPLIPDKVAEEKGPSLLIKPDDTVLLNEQPINIGDLSTSLKINRGEKDPPILISTSPELPMKYFLEVISKLTSAWRANFVIRIGNEEIQVLPMPTEACGNDPETGEEVHSASWFKRDINGNYMEKRVAILSKLEIPAFPGGKDERWQFEGKQVTSYPEIIDLLKSNKLFPNNIAIRYKWRENSTIREFISFMQNMKSLGVRFIELTRNPLSEEIKLHELTIETRRINTRMPKETEDSENSGNGILEDSEDSILK